MQVLQFVLFAENRQKPLKILDLTCNFKTFKSFELIDLYIFYNGKYQKTLCKLSDSSREQILLDTSKWLQILHNI